MNRLHLWYENIFKKDCIYKFQTFSVCKFPSLKKIAVNINNNEVKNILPSITTLELITSQKPVFYTARKSIAAFKLREGVLIGSKVLLRKKNMFDFLDLFIFLVLPKVPNLKPFPIVDFSKNYQVCFAILDLTVFTQVNSYSERFQKNSGCSITFVCNHTTSLMQSALLQSFQLPQKASEIIV